MVQGVVVENGYLLDCNPATGELIQKVKIATSDEVKQAIKQAKAAQPKWALTPLETRIELLKKGLQKLAAKKEKVAKLATSEMGKIANEALDEVSDAVKKDKFFQLLKEANQPELVKSDNGAESYIVRDPLGVVAVLSPWNFPVDEILLLALPALAAGNTVIVKPSEVVPLTGNEVVQSFIEVLPPNVIQILQGDGSVGAALVSSDIDMVAMTGSTAVGRIIMKEASKDLKRLVLELGGKDPMVVFADSDLEKAAEDAIFFSLFNCGQVCCSVERIYVAKSIHDKFITKVLEKAKKMIDSGEFGIGPMVSRTQRQIVKEHVDDAVKNGAKLIYQQKGERFAEGAKGNFYPATVLSNVKPEMRISKEETFGPVVCLFEFDGSEEEAIRLSNDTEYGLSASVYTQDLDKAMRVSNLIRAGQVGINNWPLANAPKECPWIGHKGSGFGFHSGKDGWRQFSLPKSLIATVPIKKHAKFIAE